MLTTTKSSSRRDVNGGRSVLFGVVEKAINCVIPKECAADLDRFGSLGSQQLRA